MKSSRNLVVAVSASVLLAAVLILGLYSNTAILKSVAAQAQDDSREERMRMMKERVMDRISERLSTQGVLRVGAMGTLASFQNNEGGDPAWIVSGPWRLLIEPSEGNKTSPTVHLRASFAMVMFDGSAKHRHQVYDFELTNWSVEEGEGEASDVQSITFDGTATITLRDGPMESVPLSIKIMKGGAISIAVDEQVVSHFGDTPIYGIVHRSRLPLS